MSPIELLVEFGSVVDGGNARWFDSDERINASGMLYFVVRTNQESPGYDG